jgi:hypothetical protein
MAPLPKTVTSADGRCGITLTDFQLGMDITVAIEYGEAQNSSQLPNALLYEVRDYDPTYYPKRWYPCVWVRIHVYDS